MVLLVRDAVAEDREFARIEVRRKQRVDRGIAVGARARAVLDLGADLVDVGLERVFARLDRDILAIPEDLGADGGDRARELGHGRRRGHRVAEVAVHLGVSLRLWSVLLDRAADAEDADHERQPRRVEVAADIADEVREDLAVGVVAALLPAVRVRAAIDHVVPALEPHEARKLVAARGIVPGHHARNVGEHGADMPDHLAVEDAGRGILLGARLLGVDATLAQTLELGLVELVATCAWRTEVGVQALATPRGLDEQDRLVEQARDGDAEAELGPDLLTALASTEASGQLADLLVRRAADR